jgi:hypothetical protein
MRDMDIVSMAFRMEVRKELGCRIICDLSDGFIPVP